jgi:hypothetical protein
MFLYGHVSYIYASAAVLAGLLAAREMRWVRIKLPQVHRQTDKMWAFQFGPVTAAGMWGAHIGLGFASVIRHGGFMVLVMFALALGPFMGALLFAAYWAGRAFPIWFIPFVTPVHNDSEFLADLIQSCDSAFRHVAAVGLLCSAVVALNLVRLLLS